MHVLLQDIRYALRSLGASKVFTLAVLVTLAIAIGINTATFSIVKGILYPERIYKEPDQLIVIRDRVTEINYQTYEQWLRDFNFFESIGGSRLTVHFLTENGEPKRLVGFHVTSGLFNTLGVQPLMGRTFFPQEDLSGAPLKVVLSEALWSSSYGRDPNIIGKMIRMNSESYEVIGKKRAILLVVILFAIAAVILAAVGTYGVLDHYISRKQQEIGVRISVGAGRSDILKLVFGHGFRIVFLGIALGLILCLSLNKILQAHLYGVAGTDTWTYVFVTTFLFLIATIACLIPAKRAMSVDPISVLKAE